MTTIRETISYQTERRPAIRVSQTFSFDAVTKRFVIFGGRGNDILVLGDTWEFNPATQTYLQRQPITPPSKRAVDGQTYDPVLKQHIFFGGADDLLVLGGTYAYDSAIPQWNLLTPSTPPEDRLGHNQAYDSVRKVHILFGGINSAFSAVLGDLHELDTLANTWTVAVPNTATIYETPPAARASHLMTYDAHRNLTVIVGGFDITVSIFEQTWLWDGTGFRQQTSALNPPAEQMTDGALVYVPALKKVILFGGSVFPTLGNDRTWALDEDGWQEIFPVLPLPSPERRNIVGGTDGLQFYIFGGNSPTTTFNEIWAFDGFNWVEVRAGFEFDNTEIAPIKLEIDQGARLLNIP